MFPSGSRALELEVVLPTAVVIGRRDLAQSTQKNMHHI